MKSLSFTLLLVLAFTTFCTAQVTFALTTDTVIGTAEVPEITAAAHDTVFNLTSNSLTINWTRYILSISPGCVIQICDPNNCYLPTVSSKNFTISANPNNNIGLMVVDLVDTLLSGNPANAIVRIKYTSLAQASDTADTYYLLSITETTGVHDPASVSRVVLYPNPVTESFTLDNAEAVRKIRVYDLNGRQVAEYAATSGQHYSLSGQPSGTYFVALADENGRVFRALQVIKE